MRTPITILTLALTAVALGCSPNPPSQDQVRHDTAVATATVASDIKGAAEGLRDGIHQEVHPASKSEDAVNINTATRPNLEALPGITKPLAAKIIAHRPYSDTSDLKSKHVLTGDQYDAISGRITAN